jgi:hypothetical protein
MHAKATTQVRPEVNAIDGSERNNRSGGRLEQKREA